MRIDNNQLRQIVKNEGTVDGLAQVSPTGVLRLCLDLLEAREELTKLKQARATLDS